MFGPVGWQEILLILVLALLVFGPRRLPELGRTLGRALAEFRRATTDLKRTLNAEIALEDDERPRTPRRPELAAPPGEAGGERGRPRAGSAGAPPAATLPRGADADVEADPPAATEASEPKEAPGTPPVDARADDAGSDDAPADREPAITTH